MGPGCPSPPAPPSAYGSEGHQGRSRPARVVQSERGSLLLREFRGRVWEGKKEEAGKEEGEIDGERMKGKEEEAGEEWGRKGRWNNVG